MTSFVSVERHRSWAFRKSLTYLWPCSVNPQSGQSVDEYYLQVEPVTATSYASKSVRYFTSSSHWVYFLSWRSRSLLAYSAHQYLQLDQTPTLTPRMMCPKAAGIELWALGRPRAQSSAYYAWSYPFRPTATVICTVTGAVGVLFDWSCWRHSLASVCCSNCYYHFALRLDCQCWSEMAALTLRLSCSFLLDFLTTSLVTVSNSGWTKSAHSCRQVRLRSSDWCRPSLLPCQCRYPLLKCRNVGALSYYWFCLCMPRLVSGLSATTKNCAYLSLFAHRSSPSSSQSEWPVGL